MFLRFILLSASVYILPCYSQKSIQYLGQIGLIQQLTDYPLVKQKAKIINGWNIGAQFRYYKNKFYLNSGLDIQTIDLESNPKLELFNRQPVRYNLSIPLRIGYDFFHKEEFKIRVQTGFVPTFLLSVDKNNLNLEESNYNRFNLDLQFGIGIEFYPITLDYSYDLGLINTYYKEEFKTNGHFFTLGLLFN
ncbi:MAG: outer membrane beta-barrel protein [Saprospiraceae bacterium]|nr:outer membrane beta-barrel protein [Saprospiraceae bacterium]